MMTYDGLEQAYQENSMCEEAAVIQFLFGQLAAM